MSSSKGKGKGKKAMKSRGGVPKKGGRDGGGGGEVWRPSISDGMVEVIFVEELVRFFKILDSVEDRIPVTFLTDILVECHENWKLHIPGLGVTDLVARAVPRFSMSGSSFRDWGGLILVELRDDKEDLGLISQCANAKAPTVAAKFTLNATIESIDEKIQSAMVLHNARFEALESRFEALEYRLQQERDKSCHLEEDLQELSRVHAKKLEELETAHGELKKHVLITNQLKQRITLEKARSKIIQMLGKPSLQPGEKWKDFFESFHLEDWKIIFGEEKNEQKMDAVKRLLGVGSLASNKVIHEIEYEEIYESIFTLEVGKDQVAWLWLLDFVFSLLEEDIKSSCGILSQ